MDWFERITGGFGEEEYASTQARLQVDGNALVNEVTGQRWAMGRLEVVSLAEVSTEPAVQTMSCCSTKPDFGRKRGVKYVTNEKAAMQACTITRQAQARPATSTTTQEATELRIALREMHALASKYLAITGGGLSDGSEAEAVNRAATLLHCGAHSKSAKR